LRKWHKEGEMVGIEIGRLGVPTWDLGAYAVHLSIPPFPLVEKILDKSVD